MREFFCITFLVWMIETNIRYDESKKRLVNFIVERKIE